MFSASDPLKNVGSGSRSYEGWQMSNLFQFAMQKRTSIKEGNVPMKTNHLLATTLFVAVQLSSSLVAAAPQAPPQKGHQAAFSASGLTNEDVTVLLQSVP